MVIEGAVSGDVFVEYMRQVLVHELRAGQVVIMDGLGAHHRPEVKVLLAAAGCSLLLLWPKPVRCCCRAKRLSYS